MKKLFALAFIAAALVGCSTTGSGDRLRSYKITVHHVKMPDDTYRLYEHPTDKSFLVSPSLGKVMAIGAAQGATFGAVDAMTPEQKLEAAANQHLAETGRGNCKVVRGYLIQKPLYEFWFECS